MQWINEIKLRDSLSGYLLEQEMKRQQNCLELIPSENFVSPAVLQALGSIATNKYSEGYPGKKYYGGNQYIEKIELLAIERAKKLFNAEHVNVQPLSGAPANIAVYSALLEPGDTILGMDLSHGGHLTHGHPVTFMAKIYKYVRYKTDLNSGLIDYENLRKLALEHKPKLILAGFSAYSRELDYNAFQKIADEIGALTMADIAHIAGLIAAGVLNNPVPIFDVVTTTTHKTLRGPRGGMIMCKAKHAKLIDKGVFPGFQGGPHMNNISALAIALHEAMQPEFKEYAKQIVKNTKVLENIFRDEGLRICFGKTENHLLLIDVRPFNIDGKQAQEILDSVNITLNMNMIPDDPNPPMRPSGIRLGTPAVTTRGMKETEMEKIGKMIVSVLKNKASEEIKQNVREEVKELVKQFPLYSDFEY